MGLKTWALRRAVGPLPITDDIVGHLSTFSRSGETVEVEVPGELLSAGAGSVSRAVRTRAATQLGVDWVWPYWLERQLNPRSPAFVPPGHLPLLANVTGRNWTMVGNVGSARKAVVDPRGLVTPWYDGWSLDWWIGAEDRWHFPSREAGVRQQLVGNAPVVETLMRVPGGDAVQRVYAVPGAEELVIVELENRSPVPFAVAVAVRPYNPEGSAVVECIRMVDNVVTVDGRPALLFPKAPARMAGSTFHDGDCARIVEAGEAASSLPDPLRCDMGLAQAAFLFPLPHTAVLRVAVPMAASSRTRRKGPARRRVERLPSLPAVLPSSDEVARGWGAQSDRGMRLELPEGRLADAVAANRRYMLLFHDGPEVVPGPYTCFSFRAAAAMLGALDRYGFHAESAEVIEHFPDRIKGDGFFFSPRQEPDANGAALFAMAEHWRLTRSLKSIDVESVAAAVQWIERKRSSKPRRPDTTLRGLMPPSIPAEHLGPSDYCYGDSFWSLRGLLDGAVLLRAAGQSEAALQAKGWAASLRAALSTSLSEVASRLGTAAMPAGPRRRIDAGVIDSLVACSPLGLSAADDPAVVATMDVARSRFTLGDAFVQGTSPTGLGTYLTLQLAYVELAAGDRRALDRLTWLLEAATPTFTWPEAVHPQLGTGCLGDGHHGWAAADFLSFVRSLLVREVGDDQLVMCSMLPDAWLGQGIEVHDAPTHFGRLSFAVRWHGDRPALLWELAPHADIAAGSVTLTAPGLDLTWSTTDLRGETLLAPLDPPLRLQ